MLSSTSILALVVIAVALYLGFSKRFLATGAMVVANFVVHILNAFSGNVAICRGGVVCEQGVHTQGDVLGVRSVVQQELGLHGDWLAAGEPMAFLQLLTSMFVHADIWHLIGNIIVLLAFAIPFEDRVGHRPFLAMYLGSGLVAAFAHMATDWGSPSVLMGASGAVFGIIGAFAGSYPNLVIPLPLPLGFVMVFVRMRVIVAAGVFSLQQMVLQFFSAYNPGDRTAYFAHFGGLAAGLVLAFLFVRPRKGRQAVAKEAVLDLEKLRPFARTMPAQNALARLGMNMDEPQLAAAWGERFLQHASCPTCGSLVAIQKAQVLCHNGHRFDVRAA